MGKEQILSAETTPVLVSEDVAFAVMRDGSLMANLSKLQPFEAMLVAGGACQSLNALCEDEFLRLALLFMALHDTMGKRIDKRAKEIEKDESEH